MIHIEKEDPNSPEAVQLMNELSEYLESLTGSSGRGSFDPEDVTVPRSLFIVARDEAGEAIGCAALRPIDENVAEVKRMYATQKGTGVGTALLSYLENHAKLLGYSHIWLETRLVNKAAVSFYEKQGYSHIPNYGNYAYNKEAICFGKSL